MMTEKAIVSTSILRIFMSCLFRKTFTAWLLREIEKCRWPARHLIDKPNFGGQLFDKRDQSAELIVFGSVSCEACRVNPVAPQGATKNRSLGLNSSCLLGIANVNVSLFDAAAAALIRSEYEH